MDEENFYSDSGDLWQNLNMCIEPTILEGLRFAKDLIIANIILRVIIQYLHIPHNVRHSLSLVIGGFLLYSTIGYSVMWPIGLAIGSYLLILLLSYLSKKYRGSLLSVFIICFLLCCEVFIVNPKMWQQIRGIQMIVAMKIISVTIDLDRNLFKHMINPVEFGGYVLCPANCMLGPWIPFHTYNKYLDVKFLSKRWVKIIVLNLILSMAFLVSSNCIVPWYIADSSNKWLIAYRDAQAFRMSHYFVSSMSVVSMVSAGFGLTNDCHLELKVSKPFYIELPRSLVQVVIYWNIPMHQWLKNYIFKSFRPYGQFTAIFFTYAVSSLLHGVNFQLSAVLLSIGTFSYVEFKLRYKVAMALDVCCLANPCGKQCEHNYSKNSLLACILNFTFSLITLIHLTYLGVMFEASFDLQESGYSYYHVLSKWENLDFFSHFFMAFVYVIYLMM